jgi:opacity protein-like surface antigen
MCINKIKERNMNKLIISFVALVAATAANATDLPSKSTPTPPKKPALADTEKNVYGGLNGGFVVTDGINKNSPWTVGLVGGYNVYRFAGINVAAEGTYDYSKGKVNTLAINSVVGYDAPFVTPYALVGVGYRTESRKDRNIWNYGGGVRYNLTSSIELDGRYRRTEDLKTEPNSKAEDRVTLGVNYKF